MTTLSAPLSYTVKSCPLGCSNKAANCSPLGNVPPCEGGRITSHSNCPAL